MRTMIKSFSLFLLMLSVLGINAQVDGILSTSLNNLQFSTSGLYHRIETNYGPSSKTGVTTQIKFGEPEIPVVQKKYLLPLDASGISVQITDTRTQALSGAYNIYPEQPPIPLNGGESPDWVEPKTEIYQSDEPYPGKIIEIGREASTMGYKIVTVNLYPLSYIPLPQTLQLYTSIEFELQYTTGSENVIRPEKISSYRNAIVTDFIKSTVSNPENTDSFLGGAKEIVEYDITSPPLNLNPMPFANGSVPDYIIITSAEYNIAELQDFAFWKTKKGISTVIVTLEQINLEYTGVDQAEKIFYYLKDVFNNWGSLFVLLGGDTDIIPARYAYDDTHINLWRPCELYFSDVDKASNPDYNWNANGNAQFGENGDHIDGSPDHFVGRAVFDNPDELNTFINKTMAYEKADVPGLDYFNNLLFMTGYLRLNDPDNPDIITCESMFFHNNQFTGIPPWDNNWFLSTLWIQNNKMTFEDIEPHFVGYMWFTYFPQDSMGIKIDTVMTPGSSYAIYSGTGGEYTEYHWYRNGELILQSNEADTLWINNFSYADTGTYQCWAENSLAKELTLVSRPVHIKIDTGVNILQPKNKDISIYPIPANDRITIEMNFKDRSISIHILNMQGKCVLNKDYEKGGCSRIVLDIKHLSPGMYLFNLQTKIDTYSTKFIKSKRGTNR